MVFITKKTSKVLFNVFTFCALFLFFCGIIFFTPKTEAQTVDSNGLAGDPNAETPIFQAETANSSDFQSLSLPEKFPQIQEQMDVTVYPEAPKPGDVVTISVQTYGIDLNTQLLVWKLNGVEKLKGIGQKKFMFTMGDESSTSVVQFSIKTNGGSEITRTFRFSPVVVDLLWQANTYTPPFYKGKALYTPESEVVFVAMPNIVSNSRRVDSRDVVYTWKQNYDVQGSLSGFGKNTFWYKGPIFIRPATIEVEAYAASNSSLKGTGATTITPTDPIALLYIDNPLLGVLFNKSSGPSYNLQKNELKVAAYPFYFSTSDKNSGVSYSWSLNSTPLINIPANQNNIVLKRTDNEAGESVISLYIENASKILQQAVADLRVTYGSVTRTNF